MKPLYNAKPIASIKSLAAALRIDEKSLLDFADTANAKYSHFEIEKKNGKMRKISAPCHDLKIIQKRINKSIFCNVIYPDYLFGGIPQRDYIGNANYHLKAKSLVALDICDFYPNISTKRVRDVFKFFCKFPNDVADVLSKITTLDDQVPQGASTSSHIANLVFFAKEHIIVREFKSKGLIYSRLLDDICISSKKEMTSERITEIIKKVSELTNQYDLRLHKKKTRVSHISNPETLMEVTGLWLNRGKPRVKRETRLLTRSEVQECIKSAQLSRTNPQYHQQYDSISGKIARLGQLGHFEAESYRKKIQTIAPYYDQLDIRKTELLIAAFKKTPISDRSKIGHIERYHKLNHRINIVGRTNKKLATKFRIELSKIAPTTTMEKATHG